MAKKICLCCGEQFTTTSNFQKYCNENCRQKYYYGLAKSKPKTYSCAWCGIVFDAEKKRKFCSDECRLQSYGRGKKKKKADNSLSKIALLARKEGLSYGQYVAKYGL